jgi:hypothetical protein
VRPCPRPRCARSPRETGLGHRARARPRDRRIPAAERRDKVVYYWSAEVSPLGHRQTQRSCSNDEDREPHLDEAGQARASLTLSARQSTSIDRFAELYEQGRARPFAIIALPATARRRRRRAGTGPTRPAARRSAASTRPPSVAHGSRLPPGRGSSRRLRSRCVSTSHPPRASTDSTSSKTRASARMPTRAAETRSPRSCRSASDRAETTRAVQPRTGAPADHRGGGGRIRDRRGRNPQPGRLALHRLSTPCSTSRRAPGDGIVAVEVHSPTA